MFNDWQLATVAKLLGVTSHPRVIKSPKFIPPSFLGLKNSYNFVSCEGDFYSFFLGGGQG